MSLDSCWSMFSSRCRMSVWMVLSTRLANPTDDASEGGASR